MLLLGTVVKKKALFIKGYCGNLLKLVPAFVVLGAGVEYGDSDPPPPPSAAVNTASATNYPHPQSASNLDEAEILGDFRSPLFVSQIIGGYFAFTCVGRLMQLYFGSSLGGTFILRGSGGTPDLVGDRPHRSVARMEFHSGGVYTCNVTMAEDYYCPAL
ncbi:hypothetical protein J6590_004419 [Homalodisca vitripennis]|nr:hypothetical protein J6590_004419 [Homalodisca vitripennis]